MKRKTLMLTAFLALPFVLLANGPIVNPRIKWQFDTGAPVRGAVAIDGTRLYIGNSAGTVFCIDKETAREVWRFESGGAIVSQPLVSDGKVVFQSRDSKVYALDAASGRPDWTFQFGKPTPHIWGWDYYDAAPVLAGGNVLVGTGDNHLYSLKLKDGSLSWKFAAGDKIRASPLISDNKAYLPSFDGFLYVINPSNGKQHAKYATEGVEHYTKVYGWDRTSLVSRPTLAGDKLLVGSRDGGLYCLNAETLEKQWRFTYGSSWVGSSPVVDAGIAYVGWSDALVVSAVDMATGNEVWKFNGGTYFYSTPVVDSQHLYIGAFSGKVYALDKAKGTVVWEYQTGGSVLSSPVLQSGVLYIGSDNGTLYAFEPDKSLRLAVYQPEITGQKELLSSDKIGPFLNGLGYQLLDTISLAAFMNDRIADKIPSTVVFAHQYLPQDVAGVSAGSGLLNRYMEAGGRVVWLGYFPNYWVTNKDLRIVAADPVYSAALLEIDFDVHMDFGMYYAKPTDEGQRWGLRETFESVGSSIAGGRGIVPLAYNEFGRIASFWKPIGSNGGGCVVHCAWHYMPATEDDLQVVRKLAEY